MCVLCLGVCCFWVTFWMSEDSITVTDIDCTQHECNRYVAP